MSITAENLMPEIEALKDYFITAREELDSGKISSMNGIDMRISQICEAVQKAEAAEQSRYLPELGSLIDLLNSYEVSLRDFQTNVLAKASATFAKDSEA